MCVRVCGGYIVHHRNGTELPCGAALCITKLIWALWRTRWYRIFRVDNVALYGHIGGAQHSCGPMKWCIRRSLAFTRDRHKGGAQCRLVGLGVCVCVWRDIIQVKCKILSENDCYHLFTDTISVIVTESPNKKSFNFIMKGLAKLHVLLFPPVL